MKNMVKKMYKSAQIVRKKYYKNITKSMHYV